MKLSHHRDIDYYASGRVYVDGYVTFTVIIRFLLCSYDICIIQKIELFQKQTKYHHHQYAVTCLNSTTAICSNPAGGDRNLLTREVRLPLFVEPFQVVLPFPLP